MRYTNLKLILVLLLFFGVTSLQAQNMYVKKTNSSQTNYSFSNIQKMNFSSGNLHVTKLNNDIVTYPLNDLKQLNFSSIVLGINTSRVFKNQKKLIAYPNPATNVLNIDLSGASQNKGTLSIYNFEGKAVINKEVFSNDILSFDISDLPNGFYICRYINQTEIQSIKIIKQ
jgi:hypothetical protein